MKINSNPQIVYRSNFLDKIYNKFVSTNIIKNELDEEKWEIYKSLFSLFKNEYTNIAEEIQYRITGGENPNKVFLDILNREKDLPIEISMYKSSLIDIENKEWIEKFC